MRRGVSRRCNHAEIVAGKQVETTFLRGAQRRGEGDQLRHRSHPFACLNIDVVERARLHTILISSLHNHIVDLPVLGVGADIRTRKVGADGLDHGLRRDALALAGRHINGERILRIVS